MHIPKNIRKSVRLIFFVLFFLPTTRSIAQSARPGFDTIRLAQVKLSIHIYKEAKLFIDTANSLNSGRLCTSDCELVPLPALRSIPPELIRMINPRYVGKSFYLQFCVLNDTDTSHHFYFLPGFYLSHLSLYKQDSVTKKFLPVNYSSDPQDLRKHLAARILLAPGETGNFIAEFAHIKTTVNTLTPMISNDFYLPKLIRDVQEERHKSSTITYLVCGILLMMIFYSIASFYIHRTVDFLYYSAYTFLLGFLFFLKAYFFKVPIEANYQFESYYDFLLQAGGNIFYFLFLRKFANAKEDYPVLDKVLLILQTLTIIGFGVFTFLNFFYDNFMMQNQVENLIKYTWSFCTIFVIAYSLVNRSKILHYLAIGHSFLFLAGLLSLSLINTTKRFDTYRYSLVNDSLFWYELGILFELVFFLIALSYKNKQDTIASAREKERILLENEKSAIEKQVAILKAQQDERNRISADMHDELGSGVTAIRLLSELAMTKMKGAPLPEMEKISSSANELINKMNTIIWTMKSSNDTVDNMIAYVRSFAFEFLDNTDINCRMDYPENLPTIELSGEKRRNIFLCIKESLNNLVKHARATEVTISFRLGPHLVIQIMDNGIGINPEKMREFSNGMTNMRKRMETIDGHFGIKSNGGTMVTLSVPLQ